MRVTFADLDYWLVRGFSGIIQILQERLTRVPHGFCHRVRTLMMSYTTAIIDLNDGVQNRQQEDYPKGESSLATIDEWFTRGLTAIDRYLYIRSTECKTPMSPACVHSIEQHIAALQEIVQREKDKCPPSSGSTGS